MKRKIRTVTVGGRQYAWQMRWAHNVTLLLSPADDRTAVIEVVFPCETAVQEQYAAEIIAACGEEICTLKTCSPRMAAMLSAHLAERFVPRSTQYADGFVLLAEMGYRVTAVHAGYCDIP